MVDEIYDRSYQAARAGLNAGLDRAFARIGREVSKSFDTFHRIQWSAPWAPKSRDVGCA